MQLPAECDPWQHGLFYFSVGSANCTSSCSRLRFTGELDEGLDGGLRSGLLLIYLTVWVSAGNFEVYGGSFGICVARLASHLGLVGSSLHHLVLRRPVLILQTKNNNLTFQFKLEKILNKIIHLVR